MLVVKVLKKICELFKSTKQTVKEPLLKMVLNKFGA